MDIVVFGNVQNDGVFEGVGVFRGAVAIGPVGGADGAISDGFDAVVFDKVEEVGLLEMRMEFHFIDGGFDGGVAQATI